MWFSYYKIANRTTPCSAMYCYMWFGAIIPFCGRFWYDFYNLYSLVNTPKYNPHLC